MMTFRALILVLALTTLSACGLSPVYGDYAKSGANAPVAAALSNVYIDNIPDRTGQRLRNLLMDAMYQNGRPGIDAKYRLSTDTVIESIYGVGIAKDATATRSQIRLATIIRLTDPSTGEVLLRRPVKSVSSFNTLASQYTTLVTEEDARGQAIDDLSRQIVTNLELYFASPSSYPTEAELKAKADADALEGKPVIYQPVDMTER